MIPPLPGWSFSRAEDRVVLRPQEAPDDCTITYVERVRTVMGKLADAVLVMTSGGGLVRNMVATPGGQLHLACSGVNKVAVVDVK